MGNKKKAAEHGLSKKERKALAKREAEIRAELERRAAEKAAKKKAKKKGGKKAKKAERAHDIAEVNAGRKRRGEKPLDEPTMSKQEREAIDAAKADRAAKREKKSKRDEVIDPDTGKTRPEVIAARKAEREKTADEIDAAIRERLTKKRESKAEARAGIEAVADMVDRSDEEAVAAYNAEAVKVGATLLTSDAERERIAARRDADVIEKATDAVEALKHAVEVVETEHGREFVTGEAVAAADDDFAKPSESPKRWEDDTNGNGQYKVSRPSDGKIVGYTRVTTYIGCLEDTTTLTAWKMRLLLEGVAAAEENGDEAFTAKVRDIVHTRDLAIAKARKADRKGKLGVGELATYIDGAWKDSKKALDALADAAFELGGGREKAQKGTDIHELCALGVQEGIDAVGAKLEAGEITPADLADVEAFLDALKRLGAKVIGIEQVVVNDELKVAGRLDYILMLTLPGTKRASRVVADLKTGRVDYSTGKIAMQLGQYAEGTGYDTETHERVDLKLNRTKAILIHLPAGTAKATVHIADLAAARRGNKLAAEVRAWRNEGKKAIDLKTDLLTLPAEEAAA